MSQSFTIKGWHVFWMFAAFFGAIIAANAVFISAALRSFPGEETHKPYVQGLNFNQTIEAKANQAALGWSAEITGIERTDDNALIIVIIRGGNGANLTGLELDGLLRRPAHEEEDRTLSWRLRPDGSYEALAENVSPGLWQFDATASSAAGEQFAMKARLVLE